MVWHSLNVRESEQERQSMSMNKPCPKVVSLGFCVGMSALHRKNMAVSGALSVIQHVRAARWLLYVSSPRVSDIIWYTYSGEINNFLAAYSVKMIMNNIRTCWSILTKGLWFQLASNDNVVFLPGLVLNAPDVIAGNIIFFYPQMQSHALNRLFCICIEAVMARKNTVWFSQNSMVSSLCSDTNTVLCQADR